MIPSPQAAGPYRIKLSKQYRRDVRRLTHAGYDIRKLTVVVDRLAAGEPLDVRCRDHELNGPFAGVRECHIEPDWLLLYQHDHRHLLLLLIRTGSHARLFHE